MALYGTSAIRGVGAVSTIPSYGTTALAAAPVSYGASYGTVGTAYAAAPVTTGSFAAPVSYAAAPVSYGTVAAAPVSYAAPVASYGTVAGAYGAPLVQSYDVGVNMAVVCGGSSSAAEYSRLAAARDQGVAMDAWSTAAVIGAPAQTVVAPQTVVAASPYVGTTVASPYVGSTVASPYVGATTVGYGGYGGFSGYGAPVVSGAYGGGLVGTTTLGASYGTVL